jgi:hypothetical protein
MRHLIERHSAEWFIFCAIECHSEWRLSSECPLSKSHSNEYRSNAILVGIARMSAVRQDANLPNVVAPDIGV